jgi:hypothetical protein
VCRAHGGEGWGRGHAKEFASRLRRGRRVGATATAVSGSGRRLEAETGAAVAALSAAAERLSELVPEATEWDERIAVVAQREQEIETYAATVADAEARATARAAELDEQERTLAVERTALAAQAAKLASRETLAAQVEAELSERARALEARAARFHWRWLLRIWSWRHASCPRKRGCASSSSFQARRDPSFSSRPVWP